MIICLRVTGTQPIDFQAPTTASMGIVTLQLATAGLLRDQIRGAIDLTVEGITNRQERAACKFLPQYELDTILTPKSLALLFEELLRHNSGDAASVTSTQDPVKTCIDATIGNNPRKTLLALFLYQDRDFLLDHFVRWITSGKSDTPSDSSMPLTPDYLKACGVSMIYHKGLVRTQALFRPIIVRRHTDTILSPFEHLPFIGAQRSIGHDYSGIVSHVQIARGHWEIESNGRFVPGNTDSVEVVAIKVFKKIPQLRDMEATTAEFETERSILRNLGNSNIEHDAVLRDLGSITVLNDMGMAVRHCLLFPVANLNLADFLQDDEQHSRYQMKSLVLSRFIDIVDAVAYLHDNLSIMHLDIKPENILVFEGDTS